jgi:hypothetical protein
MGSHVDPFFIWLESTAFSSWMRDAPTVFAFPAILTCHTVGMGIVAGVNAAIALRVLGVAPAVPLGEMRRFMPVMWFGFWLNAVSGVLLLIAYPTKAFTNPLFYGKLTLIALAVWCVLRISRLVFADGQPAPLVRPLTRRYAVASLVLWGSAITAGRLLAYTYTRLTAIP